MIGEASGSDIARLDAEIALLREGDDVVRLADLLLDRAEALAALSGDDAALLSYAEAVRWLRGAELAGDAAEDGLILLISAENAIAVIHDENGRGEKARALAASLVDAHLDTAPLGAASPIANAAFIVAAAELASGEPARALAVVDRVIARYTPPSRPEALRISIIGQRYAGLALEKLGRPEAALARYEAVTEPFPSTDDVELRVFLADAAQRRGGVLWDLDRYDEAERFLRTFLAKFDRAEDPDIAMIVDLTTQWLTQRAERPRWLRRRRR